MTVLDFSSGPPSAASIRAAGHEGCVLYISKGRESWMTGKSPSREYLDALDEAGLKFAFVFQFREGGSMAKGDAGRGYDGGVADATEARDRLNELHCAGHPVYFAVDWDITPPEWNSRVVEYFRGAVSVLGQDRVGVYGHSRVVHWAMEDNVVAQVEPGRVLGWVTQSWESRNEDGSPKGRDYATIFQDKHGVPGPDGVEVDENLVFHEEWGWRAIPDAPAFNLPADAPWVIDKTQDYHFGGWRSADDIQAVFVHTTENSLGTNALNIVDYQTVPGQIGFQSGSYHSLVDHEKVVDCNTPGWVTWSTGNLGNQVGLHISFVWWAATTREEWLAQTALLLRGAWKVAQWVKEFNIPLVYVDGPGLTRGERGISTHDASRIAWGVTTHTDPGAGFPMDEFIQMVADFVHGNLTHDKEGFLMALTHDEQYEALGILRQLKKHYLDPKASEVEGSNFKAPVHKMVTIGDRKLEELHVKEFSENSQAQVDCDARQAEHEAAQGDHEGAAK